MKRIFSFIVIIFISIVSISYVSASTIGPSDQQFINTGVSLEPSEPDPHNDYINAKKEAELKTILMAEKEFGAKAIETAFVTCPTRPQITHYWCGLAAAEQVIRANGNPNNLVATYSNNVSVGNGTYISGTYHQFTINNWLGGVDTSGASIGQVTDAIDHFSTGSFNWSHIHVSGTGITCANSVFSLYRVTIGVHQKCGVVSVYMQDLYYYGGTAGVHYITVNGYTSASSTVVAYFHIVDPHYDIAYQGPHIVQPSEFGTAVAGTLDNVIW